MIFQIHYIFKNVACHPEPPAQVEKFTWTLERQGEPLVRCAKEFETEEEARSDIALVRKSLKGAAFAKVKSPDGSTT